MDRLEKIWKYIDGELSEADKNAFEQALNSDVQLKESYKEQLAIHQGLYQVPVDTVSADMVSTVMSRIENSAFNLSGELSSFKGIRFILMWTAVMLGTVLLVSFLISPVAVETTAPAYANLGDYMDKMTGALTVPESMSKYLPYLSLFFIVPIIAFIDNRFGSQLAVKRS